jgi:hypothetical protein
MAVKVASLVIVTAMKKYLSWKSKRRSGRWPSKSNGRWKLVHQVSFDATCSTELARMNAVKVAVAAAGGRLRADLVRKQALIHGIHGLLEF